MGRPSKIDRLPPKVRDELNQELIQRGFSDYRGLVDWLDKQGYEICLSTVHSYGVKFRETYKELELYTAQARAIAEAGEDIENLLGDAANRIALQKALQAVSEIDVDALKGDPYKLVAAIGSLNRASIAIRQYQAKIRQKAETTAEEVDQIAKEKGLSDETAALIKAKILNIAP